MCKACIISSPNVMSQKRQVRFSAEPLVSGATVWVDAEETAPDLGMKLSGSSLTPLKSSGAPLRFGEVIETSAVRDDGDVTCSLPEIFAFDNSLFNLKKKKTVMKNQQ